MRVDRCLERGAAVYTCTHVYVIVIAAQIKRYNCQSNNELGCLLFRRLIKINSTNCARCYASITLTMISFSHPLCYARSLGNCSTRLSREHYVSAAVLRLLGEEHTISNASWLAPGQRSNPLPVEALSSRILCEHHNSSLSNLDNTAKSFFSEILYALLEPDENRIIRQVTVDGDTLERWLLKACCGALASGNLIENNYPRVRELPLSWLNILFTGTPWEAGTGLHVRQASMRTHRGYTIGPIYVGETCVGGGIEFSGVELLILLDASVQKLSLKQSTNEVSSLIYRPGVIRFETMTRVTEIELRWQNWDPVESVRYWRT